MYIILDRTLAVTSERNLRFQRTHWIYITSTLHYSSLIWTIHPGASLNLKVAT